MKISISQKLLLISLIILGGNGFIGYAVYKSNQKLIDSQQWVEHTQQVIYQSGNILSLGKDIETASRGFVITNDSAFLEPLYSAEKATFNYIRLLKQLTKDNPSQQQRIDSLNFYMHKRLDFSFQSIELRSKKGLASAIAYTSTGQGKHYTDRLRKITNSIQQEEGTLLKQRKQTNERSVAAFNLFSVVMFILIAVFSILLLIAIGNYLLQNKEKEKRAAELIIANKELVFKNEEKEKRAAELIIANKELVFQNEEKEKRTAELIIANKELKNADNNVRKLNKDLEEKVMELETVNKELESFSYSVSHDLRSPLRAIHGYTQMLKEDYITQLDAEARRIINNTMHYAKIMGQLIDDLLTFSRLGRKELIKRNITMQDIVTNICNEIKNEYGSRNIQFKINELHAIEGDIVIIKQAWVNLISNAVKYSRLNEKTVIEIGCNVKEDEIIYYIKDNGVGFDMLYVDKLFGVFQRLHANKEFEGTGVGLAIVHRIISKHGGRVWAEGKVGEGAIFYFSLPNKLQYYETGNRNSLSNCLKTIQHNPYSR